MSTKVSIIVPVYNTEDFMCRCVESLLGQTLQEIEIILINDGSTDLCGDICNSYCRQDSRVNVIHKENGGPSSARNIGIRKAKGEYIAFVDSDDYTESDFCESLYNAGVRFNVDIVNCDCYRESEKVERLGSEFKKDVVISNKEILQYLKKAHETKIIWFACRNLYRRSFLNDNNILFDEKILFGEDPVFNLYAFYYAKSLYSINKCLYYYVATANSLTQTQYKEDLLGKFTTQFEAKKTFYEKANLRDIAYQRDFFRNNIEHSLVMLLTNMYKTHHKDCLEQLRQIRESDFIRLSFENYKLSGRLSRKMQFIIYLLQNNKYFLVNLLYKIKKFTV